MTRNIASSVFNRMFSNGGGRRALIVDDDETTLMVLSAVLEAGDFRCDCVSNSSEALAALAGGHHNLVLLDVGLPDIDGFRVLKALRAAQSSHSPAVVMVTAVQAEDDIIRGFGLGADDYVTKPFKPSELLTRCENAIRNHQIWGSS
jgi:two-component system, OmpR family, response regulator